MAHRSARPEPGPAFAWGLAAAALAVAAAQAVFGVQLLLSHDGPFAVAALARFRAELGMPGLLPRWAFDAFGGLGAPVFLFYPPGAFAAASALGAVLPGASDAALVGAAGVLFRALAVVSCAAWLRPHVGPASALAGGALYALMPYVAIVNPQTRMAFAETAAAALLPLAFLAADLGAGRALRTAALVAPAIAALAATHLPSTVLAGGLVALYALALPGRSSPAAAAGGAGAALGAALGLGIAGVTLVPALGLLPEISPALLARAGPLSLAPEDHFLLMPETRIVGARVFDLALLPPVAAVALAAGAALRGGGGGPARAILVAFAAAVFLTLPVSAPVWSLPLPLRDIQFPWRLLLPISLLAAALLALALPRLGPDARQRVLAVGLALAAGGVALAAAGGDGGRPGLERTEEALGSPRSDAPEYLPAAANAKGWLELREGGPERLREEAARATGCPARGGPLPATRTPAGLLVGVEGCAGPTVLPQFFFPGWSASAAGAPLPAVADPETGLVRVDLPPGASGVLLRREPLPAEERGLRVTAAALLLWAACAVGALARWRRARPAAGRMALPGRPAA